jgi:hypothetical protein
MEITIAHAKQIRERIGATHLVILALDAEGGEHVATHGETEANALVAAQMGNKLKEVLGWPEADCQATPIPRKCGRCAYFEPDRGIWCMNGWSKDGTEGNCLMDPAVTRTTTQHGCRFFEPAI